VTAADSAFVPYKMWRLAPPLTTRGLRPRRLRKGHAAPHTRL